MKEEKAGKMEAGEARMDHIRLSQGIRYGAQFIDAETEARRSPSELPPNYCLSPQREPHPSYASKALGSFL